MNGDGFEIDRGVGGRVKINVVSVANLIALIGLIGVAVSTWTALSSRVDTMGVRVEVASTSINDLKQSLTAQAVSRDTSIAKLTNLYGRSQDPAGRSRVGAQSARPTAAG